MIDDNCVAVARRCEVDLEQEPNGWYKCLCPRHDDTNPSLRIAPDGSHWKCMTCDRGGGPEELARWFTGNAVRARQVIYGDRDDVEVLQSIFEDSIAEDSEIDVGPILLVAALLDYVDGTKIDDALDSDEPTKALKQLVG